MMVAAALVQGIAKKPMFIVAAAATFLDDCWSPPISVACVARPWRLKLAWA
jgi:hypothetical protein